VITVRDLEVRAGSSLLLAGASFTVGPGDKVGLVGRNGAGKTTLTRILAGQATAVAGIVQRIGSVGYLPQETRLDDPEVRASEWVLSARGLDQAIRLMRDAEVAMAAGDAAVVDRAMRRYTRAEERFIAQGGYAAEAEAAAVTASLGLPGEVLDKPVRVLSGGQRRRLELARILFGGSSTLLLDEPTNHLDADSVKWLGKFLDAYQGGLVVVSHDLRLLAETVNRVFRLDADRAVLDCYNMTWSAYAAQRDADDRRRHRERVNSERKASALRAQADKMRSHVATATAAKNMERRAERMLAALEPERRAERAARIKLPEPAWCGRTPLTARGLSKSYGSLEVFTDVDLAVDRGNRVVVLGLNGAGKTTLLRLLAERELPDAGAIVAGHGLRLGYFAQEHELLDRAHTVRQAMAQAAPSLTDGDIRAILGSFLFTGDDADLPVAVLSGGEKTRLALATLVSSGANVLLLDEPTNNLDPASREEVLRAIRAYRGAIVLVTHDQSAVQALAPERVLLLPDGVEDLWNSSYAELVALA
jgi:ATPase subunit of ABC transporter with duplicated ATPase domains